MSTQASTFGVGKTWATAPAGRSVSKKFLSGSVPPVCFVMTSNRYAERSAPSYAAPLPFPRAQLGYELVQHPAQVEQDGAMLRLRDDLRHGQAVKLLD